MFCRSCGAEVNDKAYVCIACGIKPLTGKKYCYSCGKETNEQAVICVHCGIKFDEIGVSTGSADKKIAAGITAIFLGAFGVHKFVLGYTNAGLAMLLVSFLTCGIGAVIMGLIGLIEGITYLTKSDEDFVNIYIANKKTWF